MRRGLGRILSPAEIRILDIIILPLPGGIYLLLLVFMTCLTLTNTLEGTPMVIRGVREGEIAYGIYLLELKLLSASIDYLYLSFIHLPVYLER